VATVKHPERLTLEQANAIYWQAAAIATDDETNAISVSNITSTVNEFYRLAHRIYRNGVLTP
jgi:endonuclease V-like protein UPF0215 family